MATKKVKSETETLEQYRVSLDNVENQSEISTVMAELGYDSKTIAEGKTILATTRQMYDSNKKETEESSAAHVNFENKKEQLWTLYSLHRKKAKVVFRNDSVTADKLYITGSMPQGYVKWAETIKKFYEVAIPDTSIQSKLARLKVTPEGLAEANGLLTDVGVARAVYLKEVGESQDATKRKDAAFAKIDDWMSEFYAVAKIALEEKPQLLESLGKVVKG